jgi:hypothetical protein
MLARSMTIEYMDLSFGDTNIGKGRLQGDGPSSSLEVHSVEVVHERYEARRSCRIAPFVQPFARL